jgi:hypothetical protein
MSKAPRPGGKRIVRGDCVRFVSSQGRESLLIELLLPFLCKRPDLFEAIEAAELIEFEQRDARDLLLPVPGRLAMAILMAAQAATAALDGKIAHA